MDSQSDNTIKAGLRFLSGQQQPNGGFLSSSTSNPTDFEGAAIFHTGFFPGLILAALATLPEKSMKNRLAAFLIGQKSPDWSWNYWQRDSQEYRQLPYPDDLDDTFSALTALFSFQPELIDGNALARIIRLLTAVESRAGGPYRTWLVTADADPVWRDIDLAVNAQIDGFLATQEVQLPALTNFLDSAIRSGKVTSPYYPTPYPIFYYLSRHYRGTEKTALIAALLKRQPHTALDAALRLTSLLRLGRPANTLRKQADLLYQAQQKDGSWPAAPFCFDPSRDGRKTYAGSAALSTALCLEALSLWKQAAKPLAARPSIADRIEKTVYQEIRKRAENRLDALPAGALPTQTRTALTAVIHDNRDRQVLLLPFTFRKMLGQRGQQISDELVIGLGLANLWGWLAYSIFDDFIDDEGHPERLPSASLALRECLSLFFSLPLPTGFLPYLATTFDRIETANAAEVADCRLPFTLAKLRRCVRNRSLVSNRSIGHGLGPVAILIALGYEPESAEVTILTQFFAHFLNAKQQLDDIHDWQDDLIAGRLTPAAARLLLDFRAAHPGQSPKLPDRLTELQKLFWGKSIERLCREIAGEIAAGRDCVNRMHFLADPQPFHQLLSELQSAIDLTLSERKKMREFLSGLRKRATKSQN